MRIDLQQADTRYFILAISRQTGVYQLHSEYPAEQYPLAAAIARRLEGYGTETLLIDYKKIQGKQKNRPPA